MGSEIIDKLKRWGPERCESLGLEDSLAYCRRLTLGQYENFSVLSRFVPDRMRDGISAVYAYCRWADDLSDESGSQDLALERLAWWREELIACIAGDPRHPVFVALGSVITQHGLDSAPFHHLLDAFEQDQRVSRYATWDELLGYCRGSADPVGRLVLQLAGSSMDQEQLKMSDAVCTGLQLANHWQDVRRDILERDRIYIPHDMTDQPDFESRLVQTATNGHAPDREFLEIYRGVMRSLLERTSPLLDQIEPLLASVPADVRPMLWLFAAGGQTILNLIARSDHETVLYRVSISKFQKAWLALRASRQGRVS
jgi:squalene synthase HpnC